MTTQDENQEIANKISAEVQRCTEALKELGVQAVIVGVSYVGHQGGSIEGYESDVLDLLHYFFDRMASSEDAEVELIQD